MPYQPLWVKLPDIHPIKLLFVKVMLTDGIILPPVAIASSLKMSWPSATTKSR
jgi:hypothetical protein